MTMKVGKEEVTFRWKNYTKPTPANLERIAGAVRDLLAGATGLTAYSEMPIWLTTGLAFSILLVGQAVKFFTSVKEEEQKKQDDDPAPPAAL